MKKDIQRFAHLVDVYFDTRRNKRYGRDSMVYEMSWVANLVREFRQRKDRTLRILHNYAFLVSIPKWREIMATEFKGRLIDHEICEVVIPEANRVLSPYSYNNRKGMGAQAAINQLVEHIYTATEGYTRPARIIKLDLKGYFPSAQWNYAERCIDKVIDLSDYEDKSYLKWLAMISIHCNPAAHCELRTPAYLWKEHISPDKSLLAKPEGEGAAIGRLIWQTAMGLYINDEIIWLTEECGLLVVCFVDDIVMVVPERLHEYALGLIPELRRRFAVKGVRLNEKKFYDQPYGHGVEFLGSHIKPWRIHLNDDSFGRAMSRVHELNRLTRKEQFLDNAVSSINSYTGLLKNRNEYKRTGRLREALDPRWWEFIEWDERRQCVRCLPAYTHNARLNEKYHLNLKRKAS